MKRKKHKLKHCTILCTFTVVLLFVFLAPAFVRWFEPREYDCADFETQWDAQLKYIKGIREQERDIYGLDQDKNGLACDGYF